VSQVPNRCIILGPQGREDEFDAEPRRVAGFWYLLLILLGPLRLIYIPSKLFVAGNATATVSNIASHELLFHSVSQATWQARWC
jgi:hypothetical protein